MSRIPESILSKMGVHEIEIDCAKVKASVVDDRDMVGAKIDEFKSSLWTLQRPVVGLDVQYFPN